MMKLTEQEKDIMRAASELGCTTTEHLVFMANNDTAYHRHYCYKCYKDRDCTKSKIFNNLTKYFPFKIYSVSKIFDRSDKCFKLEEWTWEECVFPLDEIKDLKDNSVSYLLKEKVYYFRNRAEAILFFKEKDKIYKDTIREQNLWAKKNKSCPHSFGNSWDYQCLHACPEWPDVKAVGVEYKFKDKKWYNKLTLCCKSKCPLLKDKGD